MSNMGRIGTVGFMASLVGLIDRGEPVPYVINPSPWPTEGFNGMERGEPYHPKRLDELDDELRDDAARVAAAERKRQRRLARNRSRS